MSRRTSQEVKDKIIADLKARMSYRRIIERHGVSVQTIKRIKKESGLDIDRCNKVTTKIRNAIIADIKKGLTRGEIKSRHGVSFTSIYVIKHSLKAKDDGLKLRDSCDQATMDLIISDLKAKVTRREIARRYKVTFRVIGRASYASKQNKPPCAKIEAELERAMAEGRRLLAREDERRRLLIDQDAQVGF
jgi:uncharacterized protein YerC